MEEINKNLDSRNKNMSITRPPVVVLLGHVDHGKTTLLDAISGSKFTKQEFGEITQEIRACQVETKFGKITFIDTPGHSYFANLRGQGVQFADIALLVVSAVEGVRDQTVESIQSIKEAQLPVICVISKIDLKDSNSQAVKQQLAKHGIFTEGTGGNVPVVEVSAVKNLGIADLVETISIFATLNEFKANLNSPAVGVILESYLDKRAGPVSLVLVKSGVLRPGINVIADGVTGKIRAIFDSEGESIEKATPAQPVKILGLEQVAKAGSHLEENGITKIKTEASTPAKTLSISERELAKKQLRVILKTDTAGSKEAILANLPKEVTIVDAGIGNVTSSDVEKAVATGAKIFSFNVILTPDALKALNGRKGAIYSFRLIYELIDEIKKAIDKFEAGKEEILGTAKILKTFDIGGAKIAGCKVLDGFLKVGGKIRIVRDEKVVGETNIASIKQLAKGVTRVTMGAECGVGFSTPVDFKVGDVLKFIS